MAKNIKDLGYKETAVVCGKFFDLANIYTLKEMAELQGGEYDKQWEDDDKQLLDTFRWDGFEFLGCVAVKKELTEALADENVYLVGGYLVRGSYLGSRRRLYVVCDVWDEARGRGEHRAYRFNLFTAGSMDYSRVNKVYKKVMANK